MDIQAFATRSAAASLDRRVERWLLRLLVIALLTLALAVTFVSGVSRAQAIANGNSASIDLTWTD